MFENSQAYSSISARDVAELRTFYADVLGLTVHDGDMDGVIFLDVPGGGTLFIYPKGDAHVPASFTVLNFPVDDVDAAVDELTGKGVAMLRYDEMMHQDDKGIARGEAAGMGPDIAWFADPSGNILSVHSS